MKYLKVFEGFFKDFDKESLKIFTSMKEDVEDCLLHLSDVFKCDNFGSDISSEDEIHFFRNSRNRGYLLYEFHFRKDQYESLKSNFKLAINDLKRLDIEYSFDINFIYRNIRDSHNHIQNNWIKSDKNIKKLSSPGHRNSTNLMFTNPKDVIDCMDYIMLHIDYMDSFILVFNIW